VNEAIIEREGVASPSIDGRRQRSTVQAARTA
jgi:hypothetical protein